MAVGIEQLKVVFKDIADVESVIYKLLHHGGIFAAYPLIQDFSGLASLKADELKKEVQDLSPEERQQLLDVHAGALDVSDPALKAKFIDAMADVNQAVDLAYEALSVYQHAQALLASLKSLFDVQ